MQIVDKASPAAALTNEQGYDKKMEALKAKYSAKVNEAKVASLLPQNPVGAEPTPPAGEPAAVSATNPPEAPVTEKIEAAPETEAPTTPPLGDDKATPEAPKENPLSAQYAQLARKEKAMRLEAQKLKAERDAFKAEQEALKPAPKAPLDESKYIAREKLRENALAILAEEGISYDSLTQQALNAPTPDQIEFQQTIRELRNQIKELKDGQDGVKKTFEEREAAGYQQAIAQIRNDVNSLVKQGDTYEMIRAARASGDVVELIERTFKEGMDDDRPKGTLLSVEEAAEIVEKHLEEEAYKLAKSKKIQARFKPAEVTPAAPAKTADASTPKQSQVKTLTNSISSSRQYTPKERALLAAQYGPNWRSKVS